MVHYNQNSKLQEQITYRGVAGVGFEPTTSAILKQFPRLLGHWAYQKATSNSVAVSAFCHILLIYFLDNDKMGWLPTLGHVNFVVAGSSPTRVKFFLSRPLTIFFPQKVSLTFLTQLFAWQDFLSRNSLNFLILVVSCPTGKPTAGRKRSVRLNFCNFAVGEEILQDGPRVAVSGDKV